MARKVRTYPRHGKFFFWVELVLAVVTTAVGTQAQAYGGGDPLRLSKRFTKFPHTKYVGSVPEIDQRYNQATKRDILRLSKRDILRLAKKDLLRLAKRDILRLAKRDILRLAKRDILRLSKRNNNDQDLRMTKRFLSNQAQVLDSIDTHRLSKRSPWPSEVARMAILGGNGATFVDKKMVKPDGEMMIRLSKRDLGKLTPLANRNDRDLRISKKALDKLTT